MSRSDPRKKRRRSAKFTVLAIGEGLTDEAFLKYLKATFSHRDDNVSITIAAADGKSPSTIVKQSVNRGPRNYDRALVLMDQDIDWPPEVYSLAKKYGIELIGSQPCIEGVFLTVLESKSSVKYMSSDDCKKKFERKYMNHKKKIDSREYERTFSREMISAARDRCSTVARILEQFSFE